MPRQRFFDELAADIGTDGAAVIDALAARAGTVRRQRNEAFHQQGEASSGVHIVAHGAVLLEWRRRNGVAIAFRLAVAGDSFGARSFCADEPHSATARALRDTLAVHVSVAELQEALRQEPRLWQSLARMVARDAGPQLAKIIRNARIPARARLAYLLGYLDDRLDQHLSQPVGHPHSPLKQRDLAHLLDVTDETISRTIHALELDGLLRVHARHGGLCIMRRGALEREFAEYL